MRLSVCYSVWLYGAGMVGFNHGCFASMKKQERCNGIKVLCKKSDGNDEPWILN